MGRGACLGQQMAVLMHGDMVLAKHAHSAIRI